MKILGHQKNGPKEKKLQSLADIEVAKAEHLISLTATPQDKPQFLSLFFLSDNFFFRHSHEPGHRFFTGVSTVVSVGFSTGFSTEFSTGETSSRGEAPGRYAFDF